MSRQSLHRIRRLLERLGEPRRLLSYFGTTVASRIKPLYMPVTPPRIDIEPNNTCNLRCSHCQVPHWSKPVAALDEKRLVSILDQLPGLLSIKLQGMGEPFLNRQLADLLRRGEKRNISMQVISNGTVLNPELTSQLLQLGRTHLCFSIDGATAETFEEIRVGARFDKVIAGIRELVRRRGSAAYPLISLTTVVTSRNLAELSQLVELAHSLKVDGLNLQTSLTNWGKESLATFNQSIRVTADEPATREALAKAMATASRLGVALTVQHSDRYSRRQPCPWPWTRAFIAANGDVVPCCILADAETIKMGNVFEQSFAEIWNSPAYREFRRRIREHRLHDFCKNCYSD